ncbi:MAG: hypothetical protein HQL01_15485 [Nitrospirae bacterium]|nr:hypothetical protein [Nitrospirota bacterium]
MKIDLSSFSIVVLAKTHNPSILNPDFLKLNGIVEQNLTPYDVLCTPPVSHVFYRESLSVIAEFERLQFIDEDRVRIPYDSPIPYIAIRYVDTEKNVKYTASGINFVGHYVFPTKELATYFISNTFIKDGPWGAFKGERPEVGIKFAYNLNDVLCSITVEPAETTPRTIVPEGGQGQYADCCGDELQPHQPVILVKANYHLTSKESDTKRIKLFIAKWYNYFEEFHNFLESVFPEESS